MGLGGVLLAGAGIVVTVLVANGRWPQVWASMLGQGAPGVASAASGAATSQTTQQTANGTVYQTPYGDYTLS